MLLIDFIIGLFAIYALSEGYKRGLVTVGAQVAALLGALLVAGYTYRPFASLLQSGLKTFPSVINVAAYLILLVLVEMLILIIGRHLALTVPPDWLKSKANRVGGSIVSLLQILAFIAIGLTLFASLPLNASKKELVTTAHIAKPLLQLGNKWESLLSTIPSSDFTQTFNLLTVKPESSESTELGFHTTDVSVDAEAEERMLTMVNQERTSRGLRALRMNQRAREVGRSHSRDMFARGYFSHVNPEGLDPFDRMRRGGVRYSSAGENLALAPTLVLAHQGLMNSPGHRANILSPNYNTVGIGVIDGGPYGLMVTQDFTD